MPPSAHAWIRRASRILLDRPWLRLREDRVELPTGAVIEAFHVVEVPDFSVVVAVDEGEAVMVRQYRHALGHTGLEFPAGIIEAEEMPLEAARRELREETGVEAATWRLLGAFAPEPARLSNRGHLFLATGARKVTEARLDEGESLVVERVPLTSLRDHVESGDIVHALHVAAAYHPVIQKLANER